MFTDTVTLNHLIISLVFIMGSVVVGVIIEKIILTRLRKLAAKTKWEGDEVIIHAIRGMPLL
jgi:hypothetical protein